MKVGYDLHHALLTPEESGWDEVDDTYDVNGLILCQDADKGNHRARSTVKKKVGNGKVTGIWHDIKGTGQSLHSNVRCNLFGNDRHD